MDYGMSPSAPSWVDFAPKSERGLDLLGLRFPVQTIGLSLLNVVTTIAPKVRYLSFRTLSQTQFTSNLSSLDHKLAPRQDLSSLPFQVVSR